MKFIRKRGFWLFILLSLTLVPSVHAAVLDSVTRTMRYIFFNLSGTSAFQVWLKFALFIILFAALYNGGIRAMGAEGPMRRALVIITFIIALISAIFVPYKLLLYIFKLYHAILVVLFAMLPVVVGFFVTRIGALQEDNRTNRIIKGIIYVMMALITFGLIGQIQANSSPETRIFMDVLEPLLWGAIIALIAGLYNLIMAMGGDYVANQVAQRLGIGQTTPPQGPPGPPQNPLNPNAPVANQGQQAPVAANPQQIQQLAALMAQFHHRVIVAPDNIELRTNDLDHGFRVFLQHNGLMINNVIDLTPLNALTPAQRQALHNHAQQIFVQPIQQLHQGNVTQARDIMNQVFTLGHQNGQYQHVPQASRDPFENAVAAFLMHEAQLAQTLHYAQLI